MKKAEYELSKALMIIFSVLFVYLASWLVLRQLFAPPASMSMMAETSQAGFTANILAIMLAAGAGILAYYLSAEKIGSYEDEGLRVIKRLLSDDEQRVLEEVERSGEVTQDSLRFRLNWSKAKLSAILAQLDKSDLIQRKREGKTYRVFLSRGLHKIDQK